MMALRRLYPIISLARSFHSTSVAHEMTNYEKFNFKMLSYRKYGLYKDDLETLFDPDVKEALDRIPEDVLMGRIFRCIRAQQLYLEHNILPEDQWTKIDDEEHNYLQPYLKEVIEERKERDEWERNH